MRIRHKKIISNFSKKCLHEQLTVSTSFSDAGNIVVNKKCVKCGQVLFNYIFEPSTIECFDDINGWIRVKGNNL